MLAKLGVVIDVAMLVWLGNLAFNLDDPAQWTHETKLLLVAISIWRVVILVIGEISAILKPKEDN